MNSEALKKELEKLGITNAEELNEAIKREKPLNLSLMVAELKESERKAG